VGVTLLYKNGYFEQRLDARGNQRELAVAWDPSSFARPLSGVTNVTIEGRSVAVRAWEYRIRGCTGYSVPLLLLDTSVEENAPGDRELTSFLYGGDERYRLCQEVILGVGGVRTLRRLGFRSVERFHMNEGHAGLLALELLRESSGRKDSPWDFTTIRHQCIFTTHTPVPAGHDRFSYELVDRVLGATFPREVVRMLGGNDHLNMTLLAMNLSQYINGVAKKHGEVSRAMFPGHAVDAITNGVHSRFWTCESFAKLYDRHIPGWVGDPFLLRNAISLPKSEIWNAHGEAKARLIDEVKRRMGTALDPGAMSIGFARRAALYKRPDLIFRDSGLLKRIVERTGPLQIVFAGKAHPRDEPAKELIRRVFRHAEELHGHIRVIYLENYDLELAKLVTSGVDLWLNTPRRPEEASGTSGMKAAHNGVPSLSILDGWWIEGCVEGITGWPIGGDPAKPASDEEEAADLYRKLEKVVAPLYFNDCEGWIDVMRHAIALNASFFNSHRMVQQYAASAYL
jgi:starch phosphorylase